MMNYREKLKSLALSKKMPHAIIVEDRNNKSALEAVLYIIKVFMCKSDSDRPCNECSNCVKINSNSHIDIKILEGSSSKKIKASTTDVASAKIKIDDIREIREEANISSSEGGSKFYILKNADFFTTEAQNAFIKILEEPPNNVVFIIICSCAMSLLSTIRSRCVIYSSCLSELTDEDVEISKLADEILDARFKNDIFNLFKIVSELKNDRAYLKVLTEFIIEKLIYRYFSSGSKNNKNFEDFCDCINELKFLVDNADSNININLFKNYMLLNL